MKAKILVILGFTALFIATCLASFYAAHTWDGFILPFIAFFGFTSCAFLIAGVS